jgi:BirA family biotin operon repressor/biotin-[acetyl-CoA-carboxylase] ligase
LQKFLPDSSVRIKWPNDIIINDKKAGGILIENVLRGSNWTHSVIGFGLNINQSSFPDTLPYATSIKIASGQETDMARIRERVREHILAATLYPQPSCRIMEAYNELLYKKGESQKFSNSDGSWNATIIYAGNDGTLEIRPVNGTKTYIYHHGEIKWEWE